MPSIIHHVRKQPAHIRELATVGCTVVVVAIVVAVWFHSFRHDVYALLNPGEAPQAQDQFFAQESKSLWGSMLQALDDSRAEISGLFSGKANQSVIINNSSAAPSDGAPHPLPVSGNR